MMGKTLQWLIKIRFIEYSKVLIRFIIKINLSKRGVMKKILATSFIVLFQSIVLAQSIDLQEDTTNNNLKTKINDTIL